MAHTPQEIADGYNDFADYEEVGSIARAKSFITWANRLLALPEEIRRNNNQLMFDRAVILEQIKAARLWVSAKERATGSSVSFFTLENFRR